jgi:Putative auto-transporter adhesin, head GIN domain
MATETTRGEYRQVADFDRVQVKGIGELILTQGDKEELFIDANPDLLGQIKTEVKNGVLSIRYDFEWMDYLGLRFIGAGPIRYLLTMKYIKEVVLAGAGNVEAKSIKTTDLNLGLSGAGSMNITGVECTNLKSALSGAGSLKVAGLSEKQEVQMTGAGSYYAGDLKSKEAAVQMSGAGSARVWVTDVLDAAMTGLGSIDYFGKPAMKIQKTGLGNINSLGDHA